MTLVLKSFIFIFTPGKRNEWKTTKRNYPSQYYFGLFDQFQSVFLPSTSFILNTLSLSEIIYCWTRLPFKQFWEWREKSVCRFIYVYEAYNNSLFKALCLRRNTNVESQVWRDAGNLYKTANAWKKLVSWVRPVDSNGLPSHSLGIIFSCDSLLQINYWKRLKFFFGDSLKIVYLNYEKILLRHLKIVCLLFSHLGNLAFLWSLDEWLFKTLEKTALPEYFLIYSEVKEQAFTI